MSNKYCNALFQYEWKIIVYKSIPRFPFSKFKDKFKNIIYSGEEGLKEYYLSIVLINKSFYDLISACDIGKYNGSFIVQHTLPVCI